MRPWTLIALTAISITAAVTRVPATAQENIPGFELALVDLHGHENLLGTLPPSVFAPRVSPNGKQVAFELADPGPTLQRPHVRLYVADLNHLEQRRTLPLQGNGQNGAPIWSPDGQRLVFLMSGDGPDALYWRRADGSGEAEHLIDALAPEGMYRGGQQLAFITLTGNRDYGIWLLDMTTKKATRLVNYPDSEQHSSRISRDGRWIAYVSNETDRQEVRNG